VFLAAAVARVRAGVWHGRPALRTDAEQFRDDRR
jgi:hypothetical protein